MGWSGGTFSRVRNWAQDKLNSINPQAALFDQEDDNFATGLNNCITKDGLNKPSSDMDWNGKKLTNLATGTATTDAATAGQAGILLVKSGTTSITSSTTLADDASLTIALATGTWAIEAWITMWATTAGTGGFKWRPNFTGTVGTPSVLSPTQRINGSSTGAAGQHAVNVTQSNASIVVATGPSASDWIRYSGALAVTVSGTFSFQWAQNSSDVNATNIGIGSWMRVIKLP